MNKTTLILLLFAIVAVTKAEEWYEQGHRAPLTWQNFDSSLAKPNTYKFVKFFTRNCRYCRMLKQVQEELRKEKQWNFEFYDVDCSAHYDLCSAKATITGFPYVGIYNGRGQLAGKIPGYYPLETMREAFVTIEEWQAADQQNPTTKKEEPKQMEIKQEQKKNAEEVKTTVTQTKQTTATQPKYTQREQKKDKALDQDNEGWSESIEQGIKMSIVLVGVIFFNKIISPYLESQQSQQQNSLGTHIIELPLHSTTLEDVKITPANETTCLMNDCL